MDWKTYRAHVATSRELIAFPLFERHLSAKLGIGIDLGCGNGELTARVAAHSSGTVVGIDVDEDQLREARVLHKDIHFIQGDVEKNVLPSTGLTFDYALSNCCFCHLSDEGVYDLFMDLYSCMRDGGELVFLVPSVSWAKEKYADVQYTKSGISAVPRFGGRQAFRTTDWYACALQRCGFDVVLREELPIPADERLEERYRSNAGKNLLTAFVAKKLSSIPNVLSLQKENRGQSGVFQWIKGSGSSLWRVFCGIAHDQGLRHEPA